MHCTAPAPRLGLGMGRRDCATSQSLRGYDWLTDWLRGVKVGVLCRYYRYPMLGTNVFWVELCPPQICSLQYLLPVPHDVTLLRNKVTTDVIV
jgi:hypothetical protein